MEKIEPQIYIPQGAYTLDKAPLEQQVRLGIQGPPGSGKTFNALSAPNCIVTNFDRGLKVHQGRSDIVEVPFWDGNFCETQKKRDGIINPPNRRDAFLCWLAKEGIKLTDKQTLVIDSNRQIEIAFHTQYKLERTPATTGKFNNFEEWTRKIEYFQELGVWYKELKCNVIYIAHEVVDRNDDGMIIGVKPALTGKSGDTLASDFTDWYRAITIAKPTLESEKDAIKQKYKCDDATLKEWIASSTNSTIYLWQTSSDATVQCKTSLYNAPKYVVANWSVFEKYKKKV